jgi:general secretion pathway protein E
MKAFSLPTNDQKLTQQDVIDTLIQIKFLNPQEAELLRKIWAKQDTHPLELVSTLPVQSYSKQTDSKMSIDNVFALMAKQWGLEYQRVDLLNIRLESVASLIPYPYINRLGIVPVSVTKDQVTILTSEPFMLSWADEVQNQVRRDLSIQLATPQQIRHILNEIYIVQNAFRDMARDKGKSGTEKMRLLRAGKIAELDSLVEKSKGKAPSAQDGYITKITDWLISYATMERASDIHLEPKKGLGQIRFRIDGDLKTVYRLDHEALMMVIARFKILGEMKLDEKRKPQDGGIKRQLDNGKQVEMRLSTLPVNYGEKLVVRIFDKTVVGQDLSYIGFTPDDLATWEELIRQPQGLILVTGPTGSGKTTTLYTSLNKVSTPDVNVCTAEDPIEMEVDSFNQVQVNPQIGLGFADCIKSFLRQDPDIIMVGEIRDKETGEMAIQSSLTGHLVFSTLHTNGALATIQRLIDLGLPTFLINSSLTGILAQRLVRKLCPYCKEETPVDPHKWNLLTEGEDIPTPTHYYTPIGCQECKDTGYYGRLCVYELVKIDDKIKKIIKPEIEVTELREKTKGLYKSIRVNGAIKVLSGETSIDEVLKVIY